MKYVVLFTLLCPLFGADNQLTSEEQSTGWVLLFDGKTSDGWLEVTGKPFPLTSWRIEDGCLRAFPNADGFQDIRTTGTYRSFELELDWKIEAKGNSGIKYLVQRVDEWKPRNGNGRNARARGFEYQLADDANEEVGRDQTRAVGSLYSVLGPSPHLQPLIGEFNHTRLVVRDDHVEHWFNGTCVLTFSLQDPKVTNLFRSLRKDAPGDPVLESPITLQNHASPVWFKNIKLRAFTGK